MVLKKMRPSRWLSILMLAWGLVMTCMVSSNTIALCLYQLEQRCMGVKREPDAWIWRRQCGRLTQRASC